MFLTPYVSAPRPFAFWSKIDPDFDRIFDSLANPGSGEAITRWDVKDEKDHWTFTVLAPGLKAEDIKIDATAETLSVAASVAQSKPEGYRAIRHERLDLSFHRTFQFPVPIDPERVTASLADGVLMIQAFKRPEVAPTSVKVLTTRA